MFWKKKNFYGLLKKCSKKKLKRKALLHPQKTHPKLHHYFAKKILHVLFIIWCHFLLLFTWKFHNCSNSWWRPWCSREKRGNPTIQYDTEAKCWNVGLCNIWFLVGIISKTSSKGFIYLFPNALLIQCRIIPYIMSAHFCKKIFLRPVKILYFLPR